MVQRALRIFLVLFATHSFMVCLGGPGSSGSAPYRATMWVGGSAYRDPGKIPLFMQRMREMGINSLTFHPGGDLDLITTNGFGFYVENIVNRGLCLKFSSKVTDWDKFVTDWNKAGRPESAFIRDYCLEDPQWRAYAKKEMRETASAVHARKPFAYNIRDELSTTISANPFDYDFSPLTLAHFRQWLRAQYKNLDALNSEWETNFQNWEAVRPFTTDQIKNRMSTGDALPRGNPDWQALRALKFDPLSAAKSPTHWNFAPWCDFRTYMDSSLADALGSIRDAAREIDPKTPVGIEGTQMPSAWGGYDLWRLSQAVDWVEPYDIGNAREIFGSFMPGKLLMTTVFENDTNHALRRLWHLLLEGDSGALVWWSEDCIDWNNPDYPLTAKARALTPALKEMTSPLAQLFLRAEREYDPIAIHYSQSSIQVDWLLESTADGSSWYRRFSSFEGEHNQMAMIRNSWLKAFQDLGFTPRFISSEQIENGELERRDFKALILPHSLAMSRKEKESISERFRGTAFADVFPGFDEHGRFQTTSEFDQRLRERMVTNVVRDGIISYQKQRLSATPATVLPDSIVSKLGELKPEVQIPLSARVRVHRFRSNKVHLLAFERNINYQMSEDLKQLGGNQELEKPVKIDVQLVKPFFVYDLRKRQHLGQVDHLEMTVDPWRPALLITAEDKNEIVSFLKAASTTFDF
jgi:hypothetical protein